MSVTWEQTCAIALNYPGVEIGTAYGGPALRVGKKFMGRLKEDGETLAIHTDEMAREMFLQAEPDIYYITEHYTNTPYILIRLSKIHPDDLRHHIEVAWRKLASKRLTKIYDSGKEYPPAAFKKVLAIAREFPGIEEGLSWGTPGLNVGGSFIARLKEDDESLVIGVDAPERDMLLQTQPDIYYITDHYDGTTLILIRLSQIAPDDLRRHIEHVWRQAASADLIAEYESRS